MFYMGNLHFKGAVNHSKLSQ